MGQCPAAILARSVSGTAAPVPSWPSASLEDCRIPGLLSCPCVHSSLHSSCLPLRLRSFCLARARVRGQCLLRPIRRSRRGSSCRSQYRLRLVPPGQECRPPPRLRVHLTRIRSSTRAQGQSRGQPSSEYAGGDRPPETAQGCDPRGHGRGQPVDDRAAPLRAARLRPALERGCRSRPPRGRPADPRSGWVRDAAGPGFGRSPSEWQHDAQAQSGHAEAALRSEWKRDSRLAACGSRNDQPGLLGRASRDRHRGTDRHSGPRGGSRNRNLGRLERQRRRVRRRPSSLQRISSTAFGRS